MPFLNHGEPFPALSLAAVGGGRLALPADLAGHFAVVLFYRGWWCPYCNAQLAAFGRAADRLAELGIGVAALSVDAESEAAALVTRLRLPFPVGYGADPAAIAAATGAYVGEARYLQSTGFVLDPEGRVELAVYSSGAIGRLVPDDVVGYVQYLKAHA
ncbi:MAG TPA: redoxin domain-containing protein [Gemmatimonadales bacterium]|nr:redoxin domain-containing protein [Gemmatimonadales bacterium]